MLQSLPEASHLSKGEAVEVLNEIITKCVMPTYISIERSTPQKTQPQKRTYLLRIGKSFDAGTWNCLKGIMKKRNLSMKETDDCVIIY
jgi:hypothetical protein